MPPGRNPLPRRDSHCSRSRSTEDQSRFPSGTPGAGEALSASQQLPCTTKGTRPCSQPTGGSAGGTHGACAEASLV